MLIPVETRLLCLPDAEQVEKRWGTTGDLGSELFIRELRGKTVGILGYGHIGREAARLSVAFGARIVAANTSGKKTPQDGYIIPCTGDPDGRSADRSFLVTASTDLCMHYVVYPRRGTVPRTRSRSRRSSQRAMLCCSHCLRRPPHGTS